MIFSRVNKTDGKSDDEQPGGGVQSSVGGQRRFLFTCLECLALLWLTSNLKLETRPPQKQTDLLQHPEMTAIRLTSK